MFRTILSQTRKPFQLSAYFSDVATKTGGHRRDVNDVKIVGTLISDSHTLASGTKALTIKTSDSPLKYSNHNVHLRSVADFSAGQRVYVIGKLRSTKVQISEEKSVTSTNVKAQKVVVLENDYGSSDLNDSDKNAVEIIGNVASEISIKDKDSSFSVATHFARRNEGGDEDGEGVNFHRVFVYDQKVRDYIHENLKKNDRILVNGRIGHMTHTTPDGKKLYSGFVNADSIFKVARRSNVEANTNESDEVKAEN